MSKPSSLSVPKSGVSRFSKALPTVPGLDDYYTDDDGESYIGGDNNNNNSSNNNYSNTSHSRKNSEYSLPARTSSLASPQPTKNIPLPPLPPPPTKTLPPTPQTRTNPSSKVNSYSSTASANVVAAPSIAPSTPSSALSAGILSLQSPPWSAGSKMSIPRKPVANLKLPAPSPQYLAQPSPTFSLSSLLSAYMGDGDESHSPSLYETTTSISEIDRQEVAAPGSERSVAAAEATSAIAAATAAFPAVPSKPKAATGGSGSLPARPNAGASTGIGAGAGAAAATQSRRSAERNLPPPPPKDDPAAELSTPSSPRPEIWKRRPHMTQASRELPGLTLDYSHGSTADTQLPADQDSAQAPAETVKAAVPRAPPFAGGLPGRNIRPSLGAKDKAPPAAQTMGSETSKLKQIKDRLGSQRSESVSSTSSAKAGFPGAPAAQRPPTPEYRKEDAKQPTVEPFVSPVSPAASPEAPRGASPDFSKDLPPKPPKGSQFGVASTQPISRKAITVSPSQDLTAAKNSFRPPSDANSTSTSSQATVSPVLRKGDTVPAPAAAPVPAPVTASLPNDPGPARPRVSGGTSTAAVQPQPTVIQTDVYQTANPKQSTPQPTSDPRLLKSETQGLLYRGRDGTLYPEMKVEGEPHPKATYFPTQTYSSLPKDGIIKAKPLTSTHFNCFQQHKTMNRRSNRNCPLTCQACDRADLEDRWVCAFCHVRICDACHRKLGSYQWDLRRLADNLANAGPLSQSRPDTAPGLQATL
ncbi:hypothetical protein ACHAPX_000627 [Trichoderma viride]